MRNSPWEKLLREAFDILNRACIPDSEWTFGGGTALMTYFNHRLSFDIDIFLHDVHQITLLTPRLNSAITNCTDYVEASNFLKLKYPEGEIDFVLAPFLTSNPWELKNVAGKCIRVETPVEIVIKKLFYRAELLKIRDVFDVAIVFANVREILLKDSKILSSKYQILLQRWEKIKPNLDNELEQLIILDDQFKDNVDIYFETYLHTLPLLRC